MHECSIKMWASSSGLRAPCFKRCGSLISLPYIYRLFACYFITIHDSRKLTATTQRTATTPGTSLPTLFDKCVGSLTSFIELFLNMEGISCETGPMVYSPYPRKLETLNICRCFFITMLFPYVPDSQTPSIFIGIRRVRPAYLAAFAIVSLLTNQNALITLPILHRQ